MIAQSPNPIYRQDRRLASVVGTLASEGSGLLFSGNLRRLAREPSTWLLAALHAACAYHADAPEVEAMLLSAAREVRESQSFVAFEDGNVQGYVLADATRAVVAIAGSNEPADWIQNARISQVDRGDALPGKVHVGFLAHAKLAARLACQTGLLRDRYVLVTGHSLGGAAALLLPDLITDLEPGAIVSGVVTLGAPRVGTGSLVEHLATRQPTIQLWNVGDVVPHLPFHGSFYGYRHPSGTQRYLGSGGNVYRTRRAVWWDLAVNSLRSIGLASCGKHHRSIDYIERLARYLGDPAYA
jgi:hypothetical protein